MYRTSLNKIFFVFRFLRSDAATCFPFCTCCRSLVRKTSHYGWNSTFDEKFFYSFHSSTKFLEICYQDNMRTQLVKHKFNFPYYAIAPKRGSLYVTCLLGYWNWTYWKLLNIRFIEIVFHLKMGFVRIIL